MKQVIVHKGIARIHEVPPPVASEGIVVVRNYYSVISTGTEAASISFSKKSLLAKIFTEPEKMQKGLRMLREKGFMRTHQFVKGMIDFGVEVGYSSCGEVIEIGSGVEGFVVGDRVACAGAQYAHHAEYVAVPANLCAKVPMGVDPREASSATIGAIALQGIRQANLSLGESAVVVGLGLLGQLAVQMLTQSGIRVYGIDVDDSRIALAKKNGMIEGFRADDRECANRILMHTNGHGVDATLLYAATPSSEPLNTAMAYTRKRGRVVVIGSVGLSLARSTWYEKEIDVRISTSYGPGRYDDQYEKGGVDYPYAYVRWTEKRNMEAYLALIERGDVRFTELIDHEFDIDFAKDAYAALAAKPLALLLRYPGVALPQMRSVALAPVKKKKGAIALGVIGLGNFALSTHLPNLSSLKHRFHLRSLATSNGAAARQYGLQYGSAYSTTDYRELFDDPAIDAVLIATRHDTHALLAARALLSGKHVFVEKPLALTSDELATVLDAASTSERILMVGFNRRFSPMLSAIKRKLDKRAHPALITYRVSAGNLPSDHWTRQKEGGGRIVGEACHMLDALVFLLGVESVRAHTASLKGSEYYPSPDNFSTTIEYADGSLAHLIYTSLGHRSLPKERIEVHCDGTTYVVDDFRELRSYGTPLSMRGYDKGHAHELEVFYESITEGTLPIPLKDLENVTRLSFEIRDALRR